MMQNNEALMVQENDGFIADLNKPAETCYCSLKANSPETKALLFKVMNNPEKRISEMINKTINAENLFAEVVECTNETTGEIIKCPRIVLIDSKGIGYQAVSVGVFSAIKKLMAVYGKPPWNPALKLEVKQITKGERKMLTFDVVA